MSAAGDFYVLGEGRYCQKADQFSLDVDRLRRDRHELIGEVSVRVFSPEAPDGVVVSCADMNLSSQRARQERAKFLTERAQANGYDFYGLIETFCQRVIEAERQGTPAIYLRDLPRPVADAESAVEGFPILRRHPMILFGDGGTCKSYLALFFAGRLALEGWRILYADWELSADDHRLRLEQLFGDDMPPVQYIRCDKPLVHEIDRIRRICRSERIEYLVLDSVAVACAGPAEASEVCTEYFRALRSLGVGSLNLAHITKAEQGDLKPFGSSFWSNLARSTWNIKLASGDGPVSTVGLYHRKFNLTGSHPAIGYEFDFSDGETRVRQVSIADTAGLAEALPLWQRMKLAVTHQPMTAAALASELGPKANVETIERYARKYTEVFTRVSGRDGITRIALVEKRAS